MTCWTRSDPEHEIDAFLSEKLNHATVEATVGFEQVLHSVTSAITDGRWIHSASLPAVVVPLGILGPPFNYAPPHCFREYGSMTTTSKPTRPLSKSQVLLDCF